MCAPLADADTSFLGQLLSGQSLFPWFFVHSSSSSSVLCSHLSPTASPCLEMANLHKALNAKPMFTGVKTLLTNQDRPHTSAPEMAWNMQMSTNGNSINTQRSASLATNSHSLTSWFPYFLETLCLYFGKYAHTSVLPVDFCTNMVKYGQVVRFAQSCFFKVIKALLTRSVNAQKVSSFSTCLPCQAVNQFWCLDITDALMCLLKFYGKTTCNVTELTWP